MYAGLQTIYQCIVLFVFLYAIYLATIKRGGEHQRYLLINLGAVLIVDFILFLLYSIDLPIRIMSYVVLIYFQFVYFTYFYSSYFENRVKRTIQIIGMLSIALSIYFQYIEPSQYISSKSLLLYSCFLVFLSLAWFYKSIQDVTEQSLLRMLPFWVSAANLLWGGFYIFMAVGIQYLYTYDRELSQLMGKILTCVNIVTYLSYLIGLTTVHRELRLTS